MAWVLGSTEWRSYVSQMWSTARAQIRAPTDVPEGR